MKNNKAGFTLIELLVVIAIIGLLSTLSVLALNSARARARDAKRVADVRQIQTALEMYYNDAGTYPTGSVASGTAITYGSSTYMRAVPSAPLIADGACGISQDYTYEFRSVGGVTGGSYTLKYCLGMSVNELPAGLNTATPAGMK